MNLKQTKAILTTFNIRPTHSLGQNFLVDESMVEDICDLANLSSDDTVLEIGPGLGHLTVALARRAKQVIAIEIDRHILPALESSLAEFSNVHLIIADALAADLPDLLAETGFSETTRPLKVIANLPYYVTTELLLKLLVEVPFCSGLWLMLQKEAADRITALPSTKEYGPVNVLARSLGEIKCALQVGRGSFYPQPHVDSAVLQILPLPPEKRLIDSENLKPYADFVKACFAQRRKTLANSFQPPPKLRQYFSQGKKIADLLEKEGVRRDIRAEALTPTQFLQLFHSIIEN